eukprot:5622472-Amphidinium_carterae.1
MTCTRTILCAVPLLRQFFESDVKVESKHGLGCVAAQVEAYMSAGGRRCTKAALLVVATCALGGLL